MPGRHFHLAGAERVDQQVRALRGHVEKILLAGRLVVGRRRLVHVAQVVQLVAHRFFEPFLFLRIATDDVGGIVDLVAGGPGGVEVAVIFLRRRHVADQLVDIRRQLRIGMRHQRVGSAFDDLRDVAVVEAEPAGPLLVRSPGRHFEILDPACLFARLERIRNRDRPIHLEPRPPEAVGEPHMMRRHRPDWIVARLRAETNRCTARHARDQQQHRPPYAHGNNLAH